MMFVKTCGRVSGGVVATAALLGALVNAGSAKAAILLTVNVTNPSAVVLTATSGLSSGTVSGQGYSVHLLNASTGADSYYQMSGSLGTSLGQSPFLDAYVLGNSNNLIFNSGGLGTQTFVSGQTAFIGTDTADLTDLNISSIPSVGTVEVFDEFGNDTGVSVGQYQIINSVPEPASVALLVAVPLAMVRRRRASGRVA